MDHKNFDSLLSAIGPGRWTIFMFVSYVSWALLLPYFSLGGAFYNPVVDHWCSVPELSNNSWTLEQRLNYSVPWEYRGGRLERSQCSVYVRDYEAVADLPWSPDLALTPEQAVTLETKSCNQWEFDKSVFHSTVASEWNLVCDRVSLSPFFTSFYFFGAAVGETLIGFLADKYGRRWILRVSTLIFLLTATTSALVPLYSLVLAGRFVLGVIHTIIGPAYIQGMEACPSKLRTILGLLSTAPFALTGMFFGAWAYLIRDWRTLQLVCALPVLLQLIYMPFMDESPRWLLQQGRLKEAAKILKKAGQWHGVTLPADKELMILMEKFQEQSSDKKETPRDAEGFSGRARRWWRDVTVLVRTPALRKITIGLFGCWFCTGLTYWGMSLSGTTYSKDPFLYVVLSSLVEVPGYSGLTPVVGRFGRRSVLSFNFTVCAVAILTILATPKSYTWMIFSLALVGKLFITASYGLMYLVSSELFPTCVRSRGLNMSSMMARLGSIISPFIIDVLATSYWWSPSVMFGACAAMGSGFALLLPESNHKPLADTVEQLEFIYGDSGKSSSRSSIESDDISSSLRKDQQDEKDEACPCSSV
ncbi:organic cation transporter protein [Penaeus vannamei]|uniref:organic cation transporter protein n=1 Tax=Penaeus vannamei TaxID=6689 RepID=UPI00387F49FF